MKQKKINRYSEFSLKESRSSSEDNGFREFSDEFRDHFKVNSLYKGFSLMEVMISIAFIVIMSGFILKMFTTSENLNQKAKNTDFGLTICMNSLEDFKTAKTLNDFISISGKNGIYEDTDTGFIIKKYYDEKWEPLPKNNKDVSKFEMIIEVEKVPDDKPLLDNNVVPLGSLYKIKSEIKDIVSLENQKYILDFGGGNS